MSQVPRTGTEEADLPGILRRIEARLTELEMRRSTVQGLHELPAAHPTAPLTSFTDGLADLGNTLDGGTRIGLGARRADPNEGAGLIIDSGADGVSNNYGPSLRLRGTRHDGSGSLPRSERHDLVLFAVKSPTSGPGDRGGGVYGTDAAELRMNDWTSFGAGVQTASAFTGVLNSAWFTVWLYVDTTGVTGTTTFSLKFTGWHSADPGGGVDLVVPLGTAASGFVGWRGYLVGDLPDRYMPDPAYPSHPWMLPSGTRTDFAAINATVPAGTLKMSSLSYIAWNSYS